MVPVQATESHPQQSATKTQSPMRQSSLLDITIPAAFPMKEFEAELSRPREATNADGGSERPPSAAAGHPGSPT